MVYFISSTTRLGILDIFSSYSSVNVVEKFEKKGEPQEECGTEKQLFLEDNVR
jgi:hypothetical protein